MIVNSTPICLTNTCEGISLMYSAILDGEFDLVNLLKGNLFYENVLIYFI